jgi:hypothetical protein
MRNLLLITTLIPCLSLGITVKNLTDSGGVVRLYKCPPDSDTCNLDLKEYLQSKESKAIPNLDQTREYVFKFTNHGFFIDHSIKFSIYPRATCNIVISKNKDGRLKSSKYNCRHK